MAKKTLDEKLLEYAHSGKRDGYKNYQLHKREKNLSKLIAEKFGIEFQEDE